MANRATITSEDRSPHLTDSKHANHLIRKAAKVLIPRGSEYLGSAVVHYFRNPTKDSPLALEQNHQYVVLTQCLIEDVEEGFADIGWKQLKNDLMRAYGRTPPRTRTPGGLILP